MSEPDPIRLRSKSSLRQRLLITLACVLTPILLLGGAQSVLFIQESLEQRRLELMRSTDLAIDELEQKFAKAEFFLSLFADDITEANCSEIFTRLKNELSTLNNLALFDKNGVATCLSNTSSKGISMRNSSWTDRLRSGEKIIRTDAFYGPVSEQFLIALIHRIDDQGGNFAGSISIGISTVMLASYLESHMHDDKIDIAIVAGNGRVFGSSIFEQVDADWTAESQFKDGTHLITGEMVENTARDIVVTKIRDQSIFVLVSRESPGLFSAFSLAPASALGLPLLAFLLALIASWWAVDHLVIRWLNRLNRIAAVYGAGKYKLRSSERFETAPEEFTEFAHTLDSMVEKIESRDRRLREALEKRDAAIKEIHHRVKNNLQIVTSYLNLQSRQLKDQEARDALSAARHRIDALSIVHQTLYQHERLETVSLQPFLVGLLRHLSQALGTEDMGLDIDWSIDDLCRDADDAIPLALFVVEAVTNAVKHGVSSDGKTSVNLKQDPETKKTRLSVINDLRENSDQAAVASTGLGSRLMKAFTTQMKGEYTGGYSEDGKFIVELILPERNPE